MTDRPRRRTIEEKLADAKAWYAKFLTEASDQAAEAAYLDAARASYANVGLESTTVPELLAIQRAVEADFRAAVDAVRRPLVDELAEATRRLGMQRDYATTSGAEIEGLRAEAAGLRTQVGLLEIALADWERAYPQATSANDATPEAAPTETRYPDGRPGWLGEWQPWPCGRCGREVDGAEKHACQPEGTPVDGEARENA